MTIREDIEDQYKQSIRDKNTVLTNTLRLIKSAIKDKDIAARSYGIKDGIKNQELLVLFQSLLKQRKDSIESFKMGDRQDLINKEQSEIEIITSFLPKQKNEIEIESIIDILIKEHDLNSLKDIGRLMSFLKTDHSGQIDMGLAGKIAKSKLSN